ncbi:MAG: hypothetical protein ABI321_12260 [Polyangia bacterium]
MLIVLCAGAGVACTPSMPFVTAPPEDAGTPMVAYADQVVTVQQDGVLTSCAQVLPDCSLNTAQDPTCAGAAFDALGRPDSKFFDLGPNGRLVVDFYCSEILEVGLPPGLPVGPSNDFYIYATVDSNPMPIVEVSTDATNYFVLNPWSLDAGMGTGSKAGFQLEKASLPVARYVRISNAASTGTIHIDSIEALRAISVMPVSP